MNLPLIDEQSSLWYYLSSSQRALYKVGKFLLEDRLRHPYPDLSDYSYLVFPFAKLYEGFLKQLLFDLDIITSRDYTSDHFRIGKVLSPNIARRLGERSAYIKIKQRYGNQLADRLWLSWKEGRNIVFHYFPHNIRALSEKEANDLTHLIIETMKQAVEVTQVLSIKSKKRGE